MTTKKATTNCRRCHALLTDPRRVAKGIGRRCEQLERQEAAAAAAGFKPATVEKARQLITDRGIVPVRGRRVFEVVASDGAATYKTAPQACTCKAGLRGKHACYHRAAATMLAA